MKLLTLSVLTLLFIAFFSFSSHAAVMTYNDRSTYLAASSSLGTTQTIDFSAKDDGTPITNPGNDVYIDPLTLRGVTFNGARSYYNSTIYNFPEPSYTTANLPPNTFAFGLDLFRFYGTVGKFTITLSNGQTYQVDGSAVNGNFFGAISDTPIQWAKFSFNNDYIVLDNFTYAANPAGPTPTPTATPAPPVAPSTSRAYVTNLSSNNVSVIDIATNTVTATVPVGNGPLGVALKPDGTRAYVTNSSDNNVSVIDPATNTVVGTVAVGSAPITVAVTPDGTRAYVANHFSHNVSVIDTTTNTVIATVPVQARPQGIDITPDGSRVYVANIVSSTVSVIETATNAVIATVTVGDDPIGVTISPNGAEAYVTNIADQSVSVIKTATNTVTATIHVGGQPYVPAFSPDGSRVYITDRAGNSVSIIDTTNRVVIGTISVGLVPVGIALTSNGNLAYVANFNNANVSVVDISNNTVIATIPAGINPHYVAIWEAPNSDSTPPAITAMVTGTLGNDGWYTGNIDVNWSVTDSESAISTSSGCSSVTVTNDTNGTTYTCSATSLGGTGTQSVTV
jgi:YVTN family beta-propeller protein